MKNIYSLQSKLIFLFFAFFLITTFGQNRSATTQSNAIAPRIDTKITDKLYSQNGGKGTLTEASQSSGVSPLEMMRGKQEDLSKRDAFSKHFQNTDGSYTAVIGSGPLHYQKNGKWEDIDTDIIKSRSGDYAYSNITNLFESYFGATSTQGVMSKTDKGEIKEFLNAQMYWEVNGVPQSKIIAKESAAEVKGKKVIYRNLFGNIDAEFTVLNVKRKLNYIIPNKEALGQIPVDADFLVFSEDLELPAGWNFSIDAKKNILVKNEAGETTFVYPAPSVSEEYGEDKPALMQEHQPVSYVIMQNGNILTILLKIKADWLQSSERKFPVAIDPTVYPNNASGWTGWATNPVGSNDDVLTGYWSNGFSMAGFMRFNLTGIPDSSIITSITSNLYYSARYGDLVGNRVAITDINANTLTVPLYSDIWNSVTQYISANTSTWDFFSQTIKHWQSNIFSTEGISYVQDALSNDYVTVAAYPYDSSTWSIDNYAWFKGYSDATYKPQLVINYSATPTCTTPASTDNTYFINNVKFLGNLIPNTDSGITGYATGGYASSPATNMATQIPGGVINVYVSNSSTNPVIFGTSRYTKAWVDWNKDGIFDSTEKVYDSGSILLPNTTFGFVVPPATAVGDYKIRIRNYNNSPYYLACGSIVNGETEDYSFKVIADCAAKITGVNNINPLTDGKRCGVGTVTLTATGTGSSFLWYSSEFGGTALAGATGNTFTTGSLGVGTHTYYVTAVNGCESVYKTPVTAVVSPTPTITFTQSVADICGSVTSLDVASSGDKEEVDLLNEKFTAGLGDFSNVTGGNTNSDAFWKLRASPYVPTSPPYYVLKPALSSGYNGGSYAAIITDVMQTSNVLNHLTYTKDLNSTGFLNLKLDYDLYYYSMIDNDISKGYFRIDYSINSGGTWTQLSIRMTDTSSPFSPSKWSRQSITLPAVCLNQPHLRIRFSVLGYGIGASAWIANLATLDNVRLYGDKPLSANFTWTGDISAIKSSADCTSAPPVIGSPSVCINPPVGELETKEFWTINANATLSNGCTATGTIEIPNNSKIWNTGSTNWNTTNWKPNTAVPTDTKCVVVKTPVILGAGDAGAAKNLTVQGVTGNLTIAGNLTVTDFVKNTTGIADRITVKSDANLIQKNSTAPNSGSIRAERTATNLVYNPAGSRADYVYWGSPVTGQQTFGPGGFSPGTPADRFYYYLESNDKFYPTGNTEFIPGRGYAVQAERDKGTGPYTKDYVFTGTPNNGDISFNITRSSNTVSGGITYVHGYNLVSNPYPSNITFDELYKGNCDINGLNCLIWNNAYFWTNASYAQYQQGSSYGGNNYAAYNGSGGNPATTPTGQLNYPNGIVKVGQGFLVQKKDPGTAPLVFKNSYGASHDLRVSTAGTFFQRDAVQKNRYWLSLLAPSMLINTQLIGYIEGATNDYEQDYDAEAFDLSSDLFYSIIPTKNLLIQGRSEVFTDEDKVILGSNFFQNGSYTIALENAEGIFDSTQNIYLKDKQEGTITNLSQGSYTFTATKGNNTGRFEIIYKPEIVLVTDTKIKEGIVVYRDSDDFVIQSPKVITRVEVYDASGKLITVLKPNKKQGVLDASTITNGIYVLKITTSDGVVTNKKISR